MDASGREDTGREETEKERLDRNLEQLLGELRLALPGVQVLFAFLLVVPFNQRFADITSFQQTVYFVTLLCATAACACLIAPTAHHRLEFREQDKERIVMGGNRLAIAGLTLLATAMTGAITLVTDFLYSSTTTAIAAGLVALLFLVLWYAIPLRRLAQTGLAQRAGELQRSLAVERALQAHHQVPALQQQHVAGEAQLALREVGIRRPVEEQVRRALDPDRALAVHAEALDLCRLARDLAEVLGSQVAAELADQQPETRAVCLGQAGPRAVGERQLATRHLLARVDGIRASGGARDERRRSRAICGRGRASCAYRG